MASRRFKWTAAGSAVAVVGLAFVGYNLIAAQGQGLLSQQPLNIPKPSTPAFIMAVDDSGSMTFQTQFPGQDGEGCWNPSRKSFFESNGALSTSADYRDNSCDYLYVLPGPRINNYPGIPPLDSLGFARSPQYNPTYFDPTVKYEPWQQYDGVPFTEYLPSEARIDPKPSAADTRVNLTSNYYGTETFRLQDGMTYPAGSYINGTTYKDAGTWNLGTRNYRVQYWPATFFIKVVKDDTDPFPKLNGTDAYAKATRTWVANACGTGCNMWKYTLPADNADAGSKNFAVWFSYYGNRNRAMIAGMTRSLSNIGRLRVGYFRINQHGNYNTTAKQLAMRDLTVNTERKALFDELLALPANGSTPNRQAVYSATQQFTRSDKAAPTLEVCQKNAVMLFTDGYSNQGSPTVGNNDLGMGAPFTDNWSNTMADIVTKYYNNIGGLPPLRPDLTAGQVPVPAACSSGSPDSQLDCQKNLHLNFYGVTLGARGNLFNPDNQQNPYTTPAIYQNWPKAEDDTRSTIDDIWHAAVNTRGEYINARTPAEITDAMRRVLSAVTSGNSPSGGTGFSGARIGAGSLTVSPFYEYTNEGTDWFGRLTATKLSINPDTRALVQTPFWEASAQLPSASARNIFFTKNGVTEKFTSDNVKLDDICLKGAPYAGISFCNATAELTALGVDAAAAVNYLRGDTSREVRNGGKLRDRTTRLGDIVTSAPFISSPNDDYGYRRLSDDGLRTSYATYLTTKAKSNYMVYVGANDGMLHAFNGGMNADGDTVAGGGSEAFAYIPGTALGHMGNLLFPAEPDKKNTQKFQHRYYVDGQIAVGDTYYGKAWHTTLVGASGAGGRSVFGLDVTAGSAFDKGKKLWEISDLDAKLPEGVRLNIGHVLAKPVIVPVLEDKNVVFKAIFGNGFNSASGKAVLFVVDIETGKATMIEAVESGSPLPSGSNGLGSIVVIDRWGGAEQDKRSRDGISDTVYGTDQKGAVWKFDLRNMTEKPVRPLFTSLVSVDAGLSLRQPITGGITAGSGPNGGVMLYFGTGSFSFDPDSRDNSLQSIYAINDTNIGPVAVTLTRSNLAGRTVATSGDSRTLVAGTTPANARGWFIDLPVSTVKDGLSERVVSTPSLSNGVVALSTYAPEPSSSGGCAAIGNNWFFALTPLTGEGALGRATLNSPGGTGFAVGTAGLKNKSPGNAPVLNNTPFALPRVPVASLGGSGGGGGGGGGGGAPGAPGNNVCYMGYPNGPDIIYLPYPCGRQSWRQIL